MFHLYVIATVLDPFTDECIYELFPDHRMGVSKQIQVVSKKIQERAHNVHVFVNNDDSFGLSSIARLLG